MTMSENLSSLTRMADGLIDRFEKGLKPNSFFLYIDRDCCKAGEEKYEFQRLFHR